MTLRLSRRQHADLYGPTVGDQVRLADTELFVEVERDLSEQIATRLPVLRASYLARVARRQGKPVP